MGTGRDNVFDEYFGFYTEDYFRQMLAMERKRTERSRKPILLVILDIEKLMADFPSKTIVSGISSLLKESVREIDIKGWYEYNRSIGIIYTETSNFGKEAILNKIQNKLNTAFEKRDVDKIEVTFALFPFETNIAAHDSSLGAYARFYPSPFNSGAERRQSVIAKRTIDIIGSISLIFLFSPLFIVIAALIKLTSKGPVFFRQERIGLRGEPFKFIKFRSMYVNNDASIHQEFVKKLISGESGGIGTQKDKIYKIKHDPRVTLIGSFLRKTSLDEIPQFFNVLLGNMSLVGPRPPIPYEIENYNIWHLRRVLEIKPGITGYWQVAGRSTTTFDTMVRMDLQYIRRWTVWWDIKLILQTPLAVFKGAY